MLSKQDFERLCAEGYTHIPLVHSVSAVGVPSEAYLKLANMPYSFLLESSSGGARSTGRWTRYSIIGLHCRKRIEVRSHQILVYEGEEIVEQLKCDDPLQWVDGFSRRFCAPPIKESLPFSGGLVGYFAYDIVRHIEPRLSKSVKRDMLNTPDICLLVAEEVAVFDNVENCIHIVVNVETKQSNGYRIGLKRIDDLVDCLNSTVAKPLPSALQLTVETDFVSEFGCQAYQDMVDRARRYIIDGDVMQVVVSQCLNAPFKAHPFNCYRALRDINPSPYMYYFDLDDFHIVGSSPEILVRTQGDEVTVRPIAGTRPRYDDDVKNQLMEKELMTDEKELAEHLMLIDLGRNDIGKICRTGSVKVTEKMIVEQYSHVMHIVSNVVGKLRDDVNLIDVLRATFPAGTLSGAPKVRAMEIIDEFEPTKRGIYSGAVGYLSWGGTMDMAIVIRTAIIKENRIYVQAGAGLVYDSQPEKEWEETMNKARAVMRAAAIASEM